jgi:ankyrin repeat protein
MRSALDCLEDATDSESLDFMIEYAEYCLVQRQAENTCKHTKKKKQVAMLNSEKVKREINAHQFFVAARRSEIKEELAKTNPNFKSMNIIHMEMDILERANKLYSVMSAEEKRPYEEQAAADKVRYDKDMAAAEMVDVSEKEGGTKKAGEGGGEKRKKNVQCKGGDSGAGSLDNVAFIAAIGVGNVAAMARGVERGASVTAGLTQYGSTALHLAAQNGQLAVMQWLVAQGADIHTKDGEGYNALHTAAVNGHMAVVSWLVEQGVPLATQCTDGSTALDAAREAGQMAVVRWLTKAETKAADTVKSLLAAFIAAIRAGDVAAMARAVEGGASVTAGLDEYGATALHLAARNGKLTVMQWLVAQGADIHTKDGHGDTALHAAVHNGQLTTMQWLVGQGADINAKDSYGDNTLTAMQWLVAQGADIHTKDGHGRTALHLAAYNGQLTAMQWLVAQGADIHTKDGDGDNTLYYAACDGQLAAMQWLVAQGVDIHTKDVSGTTALHAAAYGGHVAVVSWLVEQGMPLATQSGDGHTALDVARQTGQKAVVQWLTKAEAKAADTVKSLLAAFVDAIRAGDVAAMARAVEGGASVTAGLDEHGSTALHTAACDGQLAAMQWLVAQGADIHTKDAYGATTLHAAALNGQLAAMQWLVVLGVDINAKDRIGTGSTALDVARQYGQKAVAQWLMKAEAKAPDAAMASLLVQEDAEVEAKGGGGDGAGAGGGKQKKRKNKKRQQKQKKDTTGRDQEGKDEAKREALATGDGGESANASTEQEPPGGTAGITQATGATVIAGGPDAGTFVAVIAAKHTHTVDEGGDAAHTSKSEQVAMLNGEEVEGKKSQSLVATSGSRWWRSSRRPTLTSSPPPMWRRRLAHFGMQCQRRRRGRTKSRLRRTRFATTKTWLLPRWWTYRRRRRAPRRRERVGARSGRRMCSARVAIVVLVL